ncbi:MAG: hypothetical protein NXI31_11095 [bacterium]|nr:hypothetical protein [bacterium]
MRLTELKGLVDGQPFRSFRIYMSDGAVHDIDNPNLIFLSRNNVVIGELSDDDESPQITHYGDPVHIVRVEVA